MDYITRSCWAGEIRLKNGPRKGNALDQPCGTLIDFFSTTESSGDRWMAFLFRVLWPLISLCFLGRLIWLWRKIHSCTLHIIARSECLGSGSRLFKSQLHHTSCVNLGKLLNLCLICQMKKLGSYVIGLWWGLNQTKKSKELNVVADNMVSA